MYGLHKVVDVDMLTNIIKKVVKGRDQVTEAAETVSSAKISKSILPETKLTCNDCNTLNLPLWEHGLTQDTMTNILQKCKMKRLKWDTFHDGIYNYVIRGAEYVFYQQ